MKNLLMSSAIIASLTMGCAPADQGQPGGEQTQTPNDKITEMDFESGEVEQPVEVAEDQEAEPTPDEQ